MLPKIARKINERKRLKQFENSNHSLKDRYYCLQNIRYAKILNPIILASSLLTAIWIILGITRFTLLHHNWRLELVARSVQYMIYSIQVIQIHTFVK